jgi:hypothetical protein
MTLVIFLYQQLVAQAVYCSLSGIPRAAKIRWHEQVVQANRPLHFILQEIRAFVKRFVRAAWIPADLPVPNLAFYPLSCDSNHAQA